MNLRAAVTWSRNVPLHLRQADDERIAHRVGLRLLELMQGRGDTVSEAWVTLRRTVRASAQRSVRGTRLTLTLDHRLLRAEEELVTALESWARDRDARGVRTLLAQVSTEPAGHHERVRPTSDPQLERILLGVARRLGVAELAMEELRIVWGRRPTGDAPRARRVRLGSFHVAERLIRLHPVLAEPDVPAVVREWVVHHEVCHWLAPPRQVGATRRAVHHAEFEALEHSYPGRELAEQWIQRHLGPFYERMMRRQLAL